MHFAQNIAVFSVYTLAMIGVICFAFFVYKKFSVTGFTSRKSRNLSIEDAIGITPRKHLYVIRAGKERFLIAGDLERTTLIAKLENSNNEFNELDAIDIAKSNTQNFE